MALFSAGSSRIYHLAPFVSNVMTSFLPSILPLVAFPKSLFSALYSSSCTPHLSVLLSLLFPSTTTFTQMILSSSSLFTHSTSTQAFLTFKTLFNTSLPGLLLIFWLLTPLRLNSCSLDSMITARWLQIAENSLLNDPSTGFLVSILGRLFDRVDLIKLVSNVRPSVRAYVLMQDVYSIEMKGRGRWVRHEGMQYNPIQGQGKLTSTSKLKIRPFSKAISSAIYSESWQLTTDS